ncbi:MAG: serine O-acetyltransferase [Geobacteraceae bacterium]
MLDNVRADLNRFKDESSNSSMLRMLARGLVSQGFQAILVYRFFRWFHLRGIPTQPFRLIIERFIEITTGISIPVAADIGKGFRIHHFGGIIFHSKVKMGENCTVYQGVTLGDKGGWGKPPTIGNNVLIGAGAKLLGDITIGDNVTIGANAVVLASIPANSIAAGIPAKVVGTRKPNLA